MTPLRSEAHQFNFKPRYNNDKDIQLIKQLEELQQQLDLKKSELMRLALYNFVKYNKKDDK